MSQERANIPEYCEANTHRLVMLGAAVERLAIHPEALRVSVVQQDEFAFIEADPDSPPNDYIATIEGQLITAEFIQAVAEDQEVVLDEETAEQLADGQNEKNRTAAVISVIALQCDASMLAHAERVRDGELDDFVPQNVNPKSLLLDFDEALVAKTDYEVIDGSNCEVTVTYLHGLEKYGSAVSYTIEIENEGLTERIQIRLIADKPRSVSISYELPDDLNRKLIELYWGNQDAIDILLPLLISGRFDEAELNEKLNELWLYHHDEPNENEVGLLLEELRKRALAAKEARRLTTVHGTDLPSIAKLSDLQRILDSI